MRTLLADCLPPQSSTEARVATLRIGFIGADAVGLRAMERTAESNIAEIVGIIGEPGECAARAARIHPGAAVFSSLNDLLEVGVDGVVIATPGALNVAQAVTALERGVAFYFQRTPDALMDQILKMNLAGRAVRESTWHALQRLKRILQPVDFICGALLNEVQSTRAERHWGGNQSIEPQVCSNAHSLGTV